MSRSTLKNIKRDHVLNAIKIVGRKGMRPSFKYELLYNNIRYSSVDIIKIASKEANGVEFGTLSGGEQTNNVLIELGFTVVLKGTNQVIGIDHSDIKKTLDKKDMSFPELQPDDRVGVSKVYISCEEDVRDDAAYEYLFNSRSQKWINEHIINWANNYNWESPVQALLRYVGIRSQHKGIFKGWTIEEAINLLEQQNHDVESIIESLYRINTKINTSDEQEELIKNDIDSQMAEEDSYYNKEGAVKEYYGNRYERDSKNRLKCIEIHGLSCKVCGFDFEEVYGEWGKGFIEVHHVKPLSTLKEEMVIDPEQDLIPVCSNCHKMIHRRKDNVLTVEELRSLLKKQ